MSNIVCWNHERLEYATMLDVGGLELDDSHADAVFAAIHQSVPIMRYRDVDGGQHSPATEQEVLTEFTAPLSSNEPRLIFVTGDKGTGKSHLIRWLKSRSSARPDWHVVYIEKRNTSLRRVIEKILAGMNTPGVQQLRAQLAQTSNEITTTQEAVSALLSRLHHLVTFDTETTIPTLPGLLPRELEDLRHQGDRLLGDFTFRVALSDAEGRLAKITRLALGGPEPGETVNEDDLHLTEADLRVDPALFEDTGKPFQSQITTLVSNRDLRTELATLCDYYLPQAKAEVFTGSGTNLLDVFEDVRREIGERGQELCLYIEDLVLLHGVDKHLAQALTIPATKDLCKLRAAIAVTQGYLNSMDTFFDRGTIFNLNVPRSDIGTASLREFVAQYLNVARSGAESLIQQADGTYAVPSGCAPCSLRKKCHATFGATADGFGLYPFNASALDHLIQLASPQDFRPREIIRQVIRAPLAVAEGELGRNEFPSSRFAQPLDGTRSQLNIVIRDTVSRTNHQSAEAELSLRNFYAASPPHLDAAVEGIAAYLGVVLTKDSALDLEVGTSEEAPRTPETTPMRTSADEVEKWAAGQTLMATPANIVRQWICEAAIAELTHGPHGVEVRRGSTPRTWRVGSHVLRLTDVVIARAEGGGGTTATRGAVSLQLDVNDRNALLIKGILADNRSKSLEGEDHGRWFMEFLPRLHRFVRDLAETGTHDRTETVRSAATSLTALRHESAAVGKTVSEAIPHMLRPAARSAERTAPDLQQFVDSVKLTRKRGLDVIHNLATASRGLGAKPVLLDVGLCYEAVKQNLGNRDVTPDDAHWLPVMEAARLTENRDRVVRDVGGEIRRLVEQLMAVIDPAEDLETAQQLLMNVLDIAQRTIALPTLDFREQFVHSAQKLSPTSMSRYRRIAATMNDGIETNVWEMLDDPRPDLKCLLAFVGLAGRLLGCVEAAVTKSAGDDTTALDIEAAVREVRLLADAIDTAVAGGVR